MSIHLKKRTLIGIRDQKIDEFSPDDVDYEIPTPAAVYGSHINAIPVQNNTAAARHFYGARFFNQALPLVNREAPLVQSLVTDDPDGRSFDDTYGESMGARRAPEDGEVIEIKPNHITYKDAGGEKRKIQLYNRHPFNRKSAIHNEPVVKVGDKFKKGALVASSNYTDKNGTMAMGINARVGVVPYKGWSMDDAIVISDSYAKKMAAEQTLTHHQEFDDQVKGGLNHFVSLFPTAFKKDQLANFDEHGIIKPGTIVKKGDPMILATAPKTVTSADVKVGKLSRVLQTMRRNASQLWENEDDGEVTDVAHGRKGVKVIVRSVSPTKPGDKIVFRSGAKAEVSLILPDDHMPRTMDGNPLDVMLNPLSIGSRVNNGLPYEIMMGKIAKKMGQPMKIPGFQDPAKSRLEEVKELLAKHGMTDKEELFDPLTNRKLENPVTVGDAYMLRLWHLGEGKLSHRGVAGYDVNGQPMRGSSMSGKAKRASGLEVNAMIAAGAYNNLHEISTVRGQQNDEFWRSIRSAHTPKTPGRPFVFNKFLALLEGAGLKANNLGGGKLRLGPLTDEGIEAMKPAEIKHGETVNMSDLEPIAGGLFDPALVGNNRYGKITLPHRMPNPAFENQIRILLGLTKKEFEAVLAGKMAMPER